MPDREHFDILLVVPLEEELLEAQKVFPPKRDLSTDTTFRFEVETGVPGLSMLMVQQEGMGKMEAYHAVVAAAADFRIGLAACLGIAGSLTGDLKLCDVCYSEGIIDVYENTKQTDAKDGGTDPALSPIFRDSPRPLVAALNFMRTFPDLQLRHEAWQNERGELAKLLFPRPVVGRKGAEEEIGRPKSKNGKVACAAVSSSEHYNNKLRGIDRKVMVIETESGGIFEAAARTGIPALAIRAISDHADASKKQLEDSTAGHIRAFAVGNAATFLRLQFGNPQFFRAVKQLRSDAQLDLNLSDQSSATTCRPLTSVISDLAAKIDDKLREFSPEYKLLEKGYRLPVPRMRSVQHTAGVGTHFSSDPEEVREALERHPVVMLALSKAYPDYSLPWVIASDLLTAVVAGKQTIPIVVDGDAIRPPRIGLEAAAQYGFDDVRAIQGTQIVFIVDGLRLSSGSRTEFLIGQMKEWPDARFVLVTRDETHIVAAGEFAASVGAERYQLSSVSFLEIAHFVEKNFGMTATASEVVALRLDETFRKFQLSAHPTYFAGISKEVLTALLQANRRAELIQLAVDGFLTLAVLGDDADVNLSKTTRARFLRALARELRVEKRVIKRDDLTELAKRYADEHAFDVNPADFVRSFADSGIIHFSDERTAFSLPFVESYLLAVELAEIPDIAMKYFDVESDDFDVATFDLYCEIKPSQAIIDRVMESLDKGRQKVARGENEKHILLTGAVKPAMLGKPDRLKAIEKRFNKISDDVRAGRGDVRRKQRLLDVADRVRGAAADQSGLQATGESESSDRDIELNDPVRYWIIATIMLGAGAEHLKADVKSNVCTALIDMAASLAHLWTEAYTKVDFGKIRAEFTSREMVEKVHNGASDAGSFDETRNSLAALVDLLEFSLLAAPTRHLLNHLCDAARLRVLAMSVDNAEAQGEIQRVVQAAWLADIEGRKGHPKLLEAIKALPHSPFVRIAIATHLMTRVYWNHWDKEDRLRLLDAAEYALRPFLTLNKGEIIRHIKQGKKK